MSRKIEVEQFWLKGWKQEKLPNGKYKITIPLPNVDMISSTGQLLVRTGCVLEKDDIIRISNIEAVVEKRESAWGWPNHNFILTIRCNKIDELKKLLTYRIEEEKDD